jgi:hypothetical protein
MKSLNQPKSETAQQGEADQGQRAERTIGMAVFGLGLSWILPWECDQLEADDLAWVVEKREVELVERGFVGR